MDKQALIRIIKEIGRGRNAARDISRADARALFTAMLAGRIPDLQLGAVLIALRIKGESLEELAGFLEACEACYTHLTAPAGTVPVVIPAYNGARQLPNLTPLFAHLIAREGVPVLIQGVTRDPGRVATCEVLAAMGMAVARSRQDAEEQLTAHNLAFLPLDELAPPLARVLALRGDIGLRGPGHTLAKMLQPFTVPAVRLVSVTHPEYLKRMREFFTQYAGGALLLRGAEGEAVAHPRREPMVDWCDGRSSQTWAAGVEENPALPESRDAAVTASWITQALAGKCAVPAAITHQVQCTLRAVNAVKIND
jgi:anthranilate phosphoribosyltransferase